MKKVFTLVVLLFAVNAVADDSAAYLLPFRPAQFIDSHGGQWTAALIGYNSATRDVPIDCVDFQCRPLRAQEAFYFSAPLDGFVTPAVVRIAAPDSADVTLEEAVIGVDRDLVNNSARSIRLPVLRIDQITDRRITFLNVDPDRFDMRTNLRVYSPLLDGSDGSVTVTVYREYEGRSSAIFRAAFPLAHLDSNGVRIGYAVISWPPTMDRTPFPMRVVVESATPVWGFLTTTERSDQPSVSIILPTSHGS